MKKKKSKKLTQSEVLKGVRKPMPPPKRVQPSEKQKKKNRRGYSYDDDSGSFYVDIHPSQR